MSNLGKRAKTFLHVTIDDNVCDQKKLGVWKDQTLTTKSRPKNGKCELIRFPPGNDAGITKPKNGRDTKGTLECVISTQIPDDDTQGQRGE